MKSTDPFSRGKICFDHVIWKVLGKPFSSVLQTGQLPRHHVTFPPWAELNSAHLHLLPPSLAVKVDVAASSLQLPARPASPTGTVRLSPFPWLILFSVAVLWCECWMRRSRCLASPSLINCPSTLSQVSHKPWMLLGVRVSSFMLSFPLYCSTLVFTFCSYPHKVIFIFQAHWKMVPASTRS